MKNLVVPFVKGFEDIEVFAEANVDCVKWPQNFPYKPSVRLLLGHDADALLARFEVSEVNAKAVCLDDNGPVWEDSCAEIFLRVPGHREYFNFETNCIGIGLAAERLSRSEFKRFGPERMARVVRRSSLPHEAVDLADATWILEVEIPFDLLGCDCCPERLEGNFYKCGDKTAVPHYVSWNPVDTPKPDFHRPEFFGTLVLLPAPRER